VLLGHALWLQRFGGDPSAMGRRIDLDGEPHEIVGVMPRDFRFLVHASLGGPRAADLWVPGTWSLREMSWDGFGFAMLARVKPPFTMAEAQAELDAIGERLDRERYRNQGFGWQMIGVKADLVKEARPALVGLLGAAACVLLIACANVAGLLLVHATARRREMAIRIALGARRGRLLAQLVVESLVLSAAAGAIGVALAYFVVEAFVAGTGIAVPRLAEVAVSSRALTFAMAVALLTGVGFSLAPALQASRPDVAESLKDGTRGSGGPRGQRLRAALVVGELALSVMVLAGAALLSRTLVALLRVDAGFQPTGVLTVGLGLSPARYPDTPAVIGFHDRALARLSALPGVESAGAASGEPLSGGANQFRLRPEGRAGSDDAITVDVLQATPGYFRAMGISLLRGRDFAAGDREGSELVVVIDEHLARAAWPNEDPLGKRLVFSAQAKPVVVGVVRQPRLYRLDRDDRPQAYTAMAQDGSRGLTYVLRTSGDPAALGPAVRAAIRELDPLLPIAQMTPMAAVVDETLAERRLAALLAGGFGLTAAFLAGLGLYGLIAYSVARRSHEFGIRMALGAGAAEIRRLVVRSALTLTATGLALGLCGALALSRLLASHLFGVSATDPITYAAVAVALTGVALVASHVPARRATRVDPVTALRAE
jgi:predicted permease